MIRVFAAVIMFFLATLLSPALLLPFVLLHALAWFALELIVIGMAVDAYFGALTSFPLYTIGAIAIVAMAEWIKPHLSMYASE